MPWPAGKERARDEGLRAEVREMFESGATIAEIASATGRSRQRVHALHRDMGLIPAKPVIDAPVTRLAAVAEVQCPHCHTLLRVALRPASEQ